MTVTALDARYMARALRLAQKGLYTTDPNPRVGCVIVQDGQIVGEGWHERAGDAHAEVAALKAAGDQAHGATAYVTLEPCCHQGRTPPCTAALAASGITRVVTAMLDPSAEMSGQGMEQLNGAGMACSVGLMEAQAAELNPGFVKRLLSGLPLVRVKLAVSMDGRTALANGESQWITGKAARVDVQQWRARSSVILTGIGTVLADDPSLNVRGLNTGRQPIRVIVDNNLSISPDAKILNIGGPVMIATNCDNPDLTKALTNKGAEVVTIPGTNGGVDLAALMHHLASLEVNEVHVEAGAVLCGALLQEGLVDELLLYMAPHIMGDSARGMFRIPELSAMQDRMTLKTKDVRVVGDDLRIHLLVEKG